MQFCFSVLLIYFEIEVPNFITNTTMLLTYATIFLILMSLGIALTRLKSFSFNSAIISSIARVFLGPFVGFVIIYYFKLDGIAAGSTIYTMLDAECNIKLFSRFNVFTKKIVDSICMIVVSTILSFITIPIVVFISLKYFGI